MHNATESLISSGTSEAINGVENNLYTINDYGKNYCDCGRNYNDYYIRINYCIYFRREYH